MLRTCTSSTPTTISMSSTSLSMIEHVVHLEFFLNYQPIDKEPLFFFSYFGKFFKLIVTLPTNLGVYLDGVYNHIITFYYCGNSNYWITTSTSFSPTLLTQFSPYCFLPLIACYKRSPISNKPCFRPWHNKSFNA
jgi:hypothetical protein